jgi:type III secretion protein R
MSSFQIPDPLSLILLTAILAMAPFFAVMATSYVKLVVVLSLIRNALGVQQIPPNMVLNGIAVVLTIYIMAPVGQSTFAAVQNENLKDMSAANLRSVLDKGGAPIRQFLNAHTSSHEKKFFLDTAKRLWGDKARIEIAEDSFFVLIPAFTVSELTSAFQIGFLLYLPFIAIDLIVSNILLAMGMMMVSPMTISLPFKLLLFVLVDGWARLIHGLVLTYAVPGLGR